MGGREVGSQEEVFAPFPAPRDQLGAAVNVRSTLIASSLRSMRERGLLNDYLLRVSPEWKAPLVEALAGVWLPMEAGIAHYRACDELPLSTLEHVSIGREVGDRIHGTLVGMMVRTAKSAGVTPWSALSQAGRLYTRLFDGGGVSIVKAGPKEAKWEMIGNPLSRFGYFRDACRGMWESAIELFCQKAYVTEMGRTDSSLKLRLSWA
jgi:hypothetical protein